MPVQIIVGADDALLNSRETRDRMERYVGNARVTYLQNAGHLLPPQTMAVAEFLNSVRPPAYRAFPAAIADSQS